MQFNFKKLPLLISTVALILSCLAFVFIYKAIENNVKTTEQSQTEWQTEYTRRNEAKSLDRTMKAIEKERTLLDTHFAYSSDIVPFLDTIEKLAREAKTKAEVSYVDISKKNLGLMIGIKATGSFNALYKFLLLLENSPYELEFNSINLQSNNVSSNLTDNTPAWEATFSMKLLTFIP